MEQKQISTNMPEASIKAGIGKNTNKTDKNRKEIAFIVMGILAIVLLYWFFGCPIYYFSGIPCPGCGTTRALMALFKLDFAAAFYFHPMVYFLPLLAVALFVRRGILAKPWVRNLLLSLIAAAYLGIYFYRFFIIKSPVVAKTTPPFAIDIQRILSIF